MFIFRAATEVDDELGDTYWSYAMAPVQQMEL